MSDWTEEQTQVHSYWWVNFQENRVWFFERDGITWIVVKGLDKSTLKNMVWWNWLRPNNAWGVWEEHGDETFPDWFYPGPEPKLDTDFSEDEIEQALSLIEEYDGQ